MLLKQRFKQVNPLLHLRDDVVLTLRHNLQVVFTVIVALAVLVMNVLIGVERPSKFSGRTVVRGDVNDSVSKKECRFTELFF